MWMDLAQNTKLCSSVNLGTTLSGDRSVLIYGYSITIGLILIGASLKMRKVKQQNFKDTKKITI